MPDAARVIEGDRRGSVRPSSSVAASALARSGSEAHSSEASARGCGRAGGAVGPGASAGRQVPSGPLAMSAPCCGLSGRRAGNWASSSPSERGDRPECFANLGGARGLPSAAREVLPTGAVGLGGVHHGGHARTGPLIG